MAQYPAVIDLADLDGGNGFRLDGAVASDDAGYSVASAGDVNGDGFADMIVGAVGADPHGAQSGSSYVVFGKASGFAATLDLSALDGTEGFRLDGAAADDLSGRSVASAGDVNGDGFADMIVGAFTADPNGLQSGSSYVVFGKAGGFAAALDLSALDGTDGFRLDGAAAGDYSGRSVASAGDVNGDGFADLIVGASDADPNGASSGSSYVVFGKADGFAASLDLSALDGTDGFRLDGVAGEKSGRPVASAGDINGDGFADLILGAQYAGPNGAGSGSSYVVFGKAGGFAAALDLSALDGTDGFRLDGVAAGELSGGSVASAGDVNGDGFADMIVGARAASPHGAVSGSSYVVFGKAGGFAATEDLSALDGSNGFRIDGVATLDGAGFSVASAGDVNGDGFADMIVGAFGADPNGTYSGSSYVVFGKAGGFAATLDLSALDGTQGFRIDGVAANDDSGFAVASAGDVNGDGLDDLIVAAGGADPHGEASGSSYVVFGRLPDAAVDRVGTAASQSLVGGDFSDRLRGHGGEDVLWGHGGADSLIGNAGDDTIKAGDGNDRLNGGSGADVLTGGVGLDVLIGGDGADLFVFTATADSTNTVRDHIKDFTQGDDHIDLHLIDADTSQGGDQAFHLAAGTRFSGSAGELIVRPVGANTVVLGDVDGDGNADLAIVLNGSHVLAGADFVL